MDRTEQLTEAIAFSVDSSKNSKFILQLIQLTRYNPGLYDPKHTSFASPKKRHIVWAAIARNINSDIDTCMNTFANLRYAYRKYLKTELKYENRTKPPTCSRPIFAYANEMAFLYPFITDKVNEPIATAINILTTSKTEVTAAGGTNDNAANVTSSNWEVAEIQINDIPTIDVDVNFFAVTNEMRRLVDCIKPYQELYQIEDGNFGNFYRRNIIWSGIASELKIKATRIIKSWYILLMKLEYELHHAEKYSSFNRLMKFAENFVNKNPNSVYKHSHFLKSTWYAPIDDLRILQKFVNNLKSNIKLLNLTELNLHISCESTNYTKCWENFANTLSCSAGQAEVTWLLVRQTYIEIEALRQVGYMLHDKWAFEYEIGYILNKLHYKSYKPNISVIKQPVNDCEIEVDDAMDIDFELQELNKMRPQQEQLNGSLDNALVATMKDFPIISLVDSDDDYNADIDVNYNYAAATAVITTFAKCNTHKNDNNISLLASQYANNNSDMLPNDVLFKNNPNASPLKFPKIVSVTSLALESPLTKTKKITADHIIDLNDDEPSTSATKRRWTGPFELESTVFDGSLIYFGITVGFKVKQSKRYLCLNSKELLINYRFPMFVVCNLLREVLAVPALHQNQDMIDGPMESWQHVAKIMDIDYNICCTAYQYMRMKISFWEKIFDLEQLLRPVRRNSAETWVLSNDLFEDFETSSKVTFWWAYRDTFASYFMTIRDFENTYNHSSPTAPRMEAWADAAQFFQNLTAHMLGYVWHTFKTVVNKFLDNLELGILSLWPRSCWRQLTELNFLIDQRYHKSNVWYYIAHIQFNAEAKRCEKLDQRDEECDDNNLNSPGPCPDVLIENEINKTRRGYNLLESLIGPPPADIIDPTLPSIEYQIFDMSKLLEAISSNRVQLFDNDDFQVRYETWQAIANELNVTVKDCTVGLKKGLTRYKNWLKNGLLDCAPQDECAYIETLIDYVDVDLIEDVGEFSFRSNINNSIDDLVDSIGAAFVIEPLVYNAANEEYIPVSVEIPSDDEQLEALIDVDAVANSNNDGYGKVDFVFIEELNFDNTDNVEMIVQNWVHFLEESEIENCDEISKELNQIISNCTNQIGDDDVDEDDNTVLYDNSYLDESDIVDLT